MFTIVGAVNIFGTSGWERTQSAIFPTKPNLLLTVPTVRLGYDHQKGSGLYSFLPVDHPLPDVRTFNTFFADLYVAVGLSYRFFEIGISLPVKYDQLNLNETGEMFYAYGLGNPTFTLKSAYRFNLTGITGGMGLMGYYGPILGDTGSTIPIRNVRERYRFTRGLVRVFNEPDHFAFGGILSLKGRVWSYDLNVYMGGADLDFNVSNLITLSLMNHFKIMGESFTEIDGPSWLKVGLTYLREGFSISLSYDYLLGLGKYPDVRYSSGWPDYWDVLLKPDVSLWFSLSYTIPLYRYKHTVRVKLLSSEGKPLSNGTVVIGGNVEKLGEGDVAVFRGVKDGKYVLRVSAKGYYPVALDVELERDTTLVLFLQESQNDRMMTEYFIKQAKQSLRYGDYTDAKHYVNMALVWAPSEEYEKKVVNLRKEIYKSIYKVYSDSLRLQMERGDYVKAITTIQVVDSAARSLGWEDTLIKLQKLKDNLYVKALKKLKFKGANRVIDLLSQRRYRKALKILKEAYKTKPSKILKVFIKRVRELKRKYVRDMLLKANTLLALDRYNEAERAIRAALREDPNNGTAKNLLRKIKSRRKAKARMLYAEALNHLDRGDTLLAVTKIQESLRLSKIPEAENLLRTLRSNAKKRKVSKEELERLYLRGLEAYQKGEYRKAYDVWNQILKYDSTYTKAKMNVERLKRMMGW